MGIRLDGTEFDTSIVTVPIPPPPPPHYSTPYPVIKFGGG